MRPRVLIADDEPLTAEMIAMMLSFHGYDVDVARDGREALDRAAEAMPDIALLDVVMPAVDGVTVAGLLRRDAGFARDGVVVLFSSSDERDVDWYGVGADAFLQKPFELRELPALLAELRERRAAGKQVGREPSAATLP